MTLLLASALMSRGRFSEATKVLNELQQRRSSPAAQAFLADASQRTGDYQRAELLASGVSADPRNPQDALARAHFVLGNLHRDRGNVHSAIHEYQIAKQWAGSDRELGCWIGLRLIAAIAEANGTKAALLQIPSLKTDLARCGEPRPFAAFHLWIAETETTQGNLAPARKHLAIAARLLRNVDDAWLQGYLAINSFGLNYHAAEIPEAKKWAQRAIEQANISGHLGAKRASFANLGHIELSLGRYAEAERCFRTALTTCEIHSPNYIAILDSIAQTQLHRGDLASCQTTIDEIDRCAVSSADSKQAYYRAWALQTKIQLLLKQARAKEAVALCEAAGNLGERGARSRVTTVLQILSIDANLANGNLPEAGRLLESLLLSPTELAPDLFADTERIVGRYLLASGRPEAAAVHFDRAAHVFDAIGHVVGRSELRIEPTVPQAPREPQLAAAARSAVDRIRALMAARKRPELFAAEAMRLLQDLDCAEAFHVRSDGAPTTPGLSIMLDSRNLRLAFSPRPEAGAMLSAIAFKKTLEEVLAAGEGQSEFEDCDVLWPEDVDDSPEPIFSSNQMSDVVKTINKIARTTLSVLITGETGTGKEVAARAIHKNSNRSSEPFIPFNCAAVPKDLLESQLFGHRKGAFSGATEPFQGVIRAANGGTLLLDEIGELPLDMQPKLLRFLESAEIHPLGESHPQKVNVRLLFATNSNLEEQVRNGRFRQDLFYRMNVITVNIPPLRERRDEIPILANLFAREFGSELSKDPPRFSTDAMEMLILYSWPGNVRQLANEIRRLVAISEPGTTIGADLLSKEISGQTREPSRGIQRGDAHVSVELNQSLAAATEQLERSMVTHALNRVNGQVTKAARLLGLSRKGLYLKRQRLNQSKI
jgi:DNA-binding NtrC family response regulator/tetratricopeptide (TPR) repeat protein